MAHKVRISFFFFFFFWYKLKNQLQERAKIQPPQATSTTRATSNLKRFLLRSGSWFTLRGLDVLEKVSLSQRLDGLRK